MTVTITDWCNHADTDSRSNVGCLCYTEPNCWKCSRQLWPLCATVVVKKMKLEMKEQTLYCQSWEFNWKQGFQIQENLFTDTMVLQTIDKTEVQSVTTSKRIMKDWKFDFKESNFSKSCFIILSVEEINTNLPFICVLWLDVYWLEWYCATSVVRWESCHTCDHCESQNTTEKLREHCHAARHPC